MDERTKGKMSSDAFIRLENVMRLHGMSAASMVPEKFSVFIDCFLAGCSWGMEQVREAVDKHYGKKAEDQV